MKRRESGFTIIETSLALAVTGLMVTVILFGIGNSLSHQRYTDAVNQTVDYFRGLYTRTTNTLNNRSQDEGCSASGVTSTGNMPVGTSDCLLLGQVMRSSNGTSITTYQVLALRDPSSDTGATTATDIELLQASSLQQGNQLDTFTPDWGARLVNPGGTDAATFTIMVVRTPVTGTVLTYTSSSDTASVASLVSPTSQVDRSICIDQTDFFGIGVAPMGIKVTKGAANTTGVQVIPAGGCV